MKFGFGFNKKSRVSVVIDMSVQYVDNDSVNTSRYTVRETVSLFLVNPLPSINKIVIIVIKTIITIFIIIIIINVSTLKLNRCKTILNIAVHSHKFRSCDIG